MLQHILFPTDGSPLSERAVPFAATLAVAQGAEVIAVRVVEPIAWIGYEPTGYVSAEVYQDMIDGVESEARYALAATTERLRASGATVRSELLRGTAAFGLLDYEASAKPDLVIMTTHGRTGLARFALGSIADRLVCEGTAPVLLIRPFSLAESSMERALIPLDGSPLAEEALTMVETLAGQPLRRVRLLRVVSTPQERPDAAAYLDHVAQRIGALGLQVEILIETGAPGRAIETAAEDADLVILSTHGRSGFARLRHGSVAEQATRRLSAPTLLIRAGATNPIPKPTAAALVARA